MTRSLFPADSPRGARPLASVLFLGLALALPTGCNRAERARAELARAEADLQASRAEAYARAAAAAQDGTPAQRTDWRDAVERITAEALARGRAYERLTELCTRAPHRLAGSADAARAVEWARDTMKADGLENVHVEHCRVPHWERGQVEDLRVLEPSGIGELPVLALGGSIATPEDGVEGELVVVESFEELAELGRSGARGKIVLFNRPMDDALLDTFDAYSGAVDQRGGGAIQAAKVDAVAALVRSMTTSRDDFPHTGAMHYQDGVPKIPSAAISTNGADRLAALVRAGTKVRLRLRLDCRTIGEAESGNVVGELRGRERPHEVVLVSGHLDCWDVGQGAHDDGSGSCHALEAVRLLKVLDLVPRRTVRVLLYMNEENGTAGARAYAAEHAADLGLHVAAFESDRGGFTPRGFSVDGPPEMVAAVDALAHYLEPLGADFVRQGYAGVDISFLKPGGVPLIGLLPDSQRYFDYHHSERDRLEAVHPRELELGAAAYASLIYLVAESRDPLPRGPGQ